MFLPKKFVQEVIIPEINKSIIGQPLQYGEFLQWIGLQLMMATLQGFQRRDFWSLKKINSYKTALIRFNNIIS